MTDATPTHVSTSPALIRLSFAGKPVRATRHPVHGRMLMARDVVEAIGYTVTRYTGDTLNGLKVAEANRILLKREDFDASEGKLAPTFDNAVFLARAGLDELVAGAAAKKVRTFRPWMVDIMENGAPPKAKKQEPEKPPEGLPWEE